ncbi:YoqO family protein [Bacillus vallismortis]|uniref:YoqO family protein n=1 Tax=Bacillus vallismortis TaxID=72361 RepID=UPI00227D9B8F|nr:YoqO family protein [Bacillus vallismortis]MEC1649434.1 YoqO family protein [Bacillus vallismortis]
MNFCSKNIVFYLIFLCLFVSIAMKSFEVIRSIANVVCLLFVLFYVKEELKIYTHKALTFPIICFLCLSVSVLLLFCRGKHI